MSSTFYNALLAGGTSRFPQTPSTGPLRGQAASRPPSTGPLSRTGGFAAGKRA